MKYMGSKRHMLENGLGGMIIEQSRYAKRFVDLFCGAGSVAWFAAEKTKPPVLAVDLQAYAVVLAKAVVGRDKPLSSETIEKEWLDKVKRNRTRSKYWHVARGLGNQKRITKKLVNAARELCEAPSRIGPIWNAYGGYYFSPMQALTFDYMLKCLPENEHEKSVCLAATIWTASKCAAAPGHTAQPFQPNRKQGKTFIREAWKQNPIEVCRKALDIICPRHAKVVGEVRIADAVEIAKELVPGDLVFVDPPYSGVQYSRFYHVLETIARGTCGPVKGRGRYPSVNERPQSKFVNKGTSQEALEELLRALAESKATVIFTFPTGKCSNGLSGKIVVETAKTWFAVKEKRVNGKFSTLGGNNEDRDARKSSEELLLLLKPKGQSLL